MVRGLTRTRSHPQSHRLLQAASPGPRPPSHTSIPWAPHSPSLCLSIYDMTLKCLVTRLLLPETISHSPQKMWQLLRRRTPPGWVGRNPNSHRALNPRYRTGRPQGETCCPLPAPRTLPSAHDTSNQHAHRTSQRRPCVCTSIPRERPPEGPAPPMTDVQATSVGNKLIKKQEGPCPATQGQSAPWTRCP